MGFWCGSEVKNPPTSAGNVGDGGLIPESGRSPWRRAWQPTPVFLPGKSPWTEEPGRLQSIGSQRVRLDWSYWAHTYLFHKSSRVFSFPNPFLSLTHFLLRRFFEHRTGRDFCELIQHPITHTHTHPALAETLDPGSRGGKVGGGEQNSNKTK